MASKDDAQLPLGAVRTEDGEVVIPASRRPDGSLRKPVRIRKGYVPQDEIGKYKPIGQRRREQAAKEKEQKSTQDEELVTAVSNLSIQTPKEERQTAQAEESKMAVEKSSGQSSTHQPSDTQDSPSAWKQEISRINKNLKRIQKVEAKQSESTSLNHHESRLLGKKESLTKRREELISKLDAKNE